VINIAKKRKPRKNSWTPGEEDKLRELFPDTPNEDLSRIFGRTEIAIVRRAFDLKLKKNPKKFPRGMNPLKTIRKNQIKAGYLEAK